MRSAKPEWLKRGRWVDPTAQVPELDLTGRTITIYADVEITRRKTFHLVMDDLERVLWRAKRWADVLGWLRHHEISEYTVRTEEMAVAVIQSLRSAEKD